MPDASLIEACSTLPPDTPGRNVCPNAEAQTPSAQQTDRTTRSDGCGLSIPGLLPLRYGFYRRTAIASSMRRGEARLPRSRGTGRPDRGQAESRACPFSASLRIGMAPNMTPAHPTVAPDMTPAHPTIEGAMPIRSEAQNRHANRGDDDRLDAAEHALSPLRYVRAWHPTRKGMAPNMTPAHPTMEGAMPIRSEAQNRHAAHGQDNHIGARGMPFLRFAT